MIGEELCRYIQNVSKFLTILLPRRLALVSRYKLLMSFLTDTPQKVDNIYCATCFANSCISFVQF